jgi:hypothetical protein
VNGKLGILEAWQRSNWLGVSENLQTTEHLRVLQINLLLMSPLKSTSYANCCVNDSWQKLALFAKTVYMFITSAYFTKSIKLSPHTRSYQFSLTFVTDTH